MVGLLATATGILPQVVIESHRVHEPRPAVILSEREGLLPGGLAEDHIGACVDDFCVQSLGRLFGRQTGIDPHLNSGNRRLVPKFERIRSLNRVVYMLVSSG